MSASSDISQAFIVQFVSDCERILRCNPLDLIAVTFSESDCRTYAHNKNGHASGMWQFMPDTARGLGWDALDASELRDATGKRTGQTIYGTSPLHRFRQLDHIGQWMWFRRYFRTHAGKLVNRAACYVATFLPADIGLAADLDAILVSDPTRHDKARRGAFFAPNSGFDLRGNKDGHITVGELQDAITRAAVGARAEDLFARILKEATVPSEPPKEPAVVDTPTRGDPIRGAIRKAIEDDDDTPPDDVA